jgi:signal recognition particle subunit SEC65
MPEENGNGNGKPRRLNNTQRKELAKLVERKYEALVEVQRQEHEQANRAAKKRAMDEARKKLGVEKIEAQIESLKKTLEDLGFEPRYGREAPNPGSKGDEVFQKLMEQYQPPKSTLVEERDATIARIWTVETVEEAEGIVGVSKK